MMDPYRRQSANQGGGDRPPDTEHWHSRVARPPLVNHQQRGNRHPSYHRQWSAYTPYHHSIQPDESHGSRRQSTRNQYTYTTTRPSRAQAGQSSTSTQSSNLTQCTPRAAQPPRAQAGQSSNLIQCTHRATHPTRAQAGQSSTCTPSPTLTHGAGLQSPRAQAGQSSTSTPSPTLSQGATQPPRAQAGQSSTCTQSSNLTQCTPRAAQPPRAQAGQSSTNTQSPTLPRGAGLPPPRAQAQSPSTQSPTLPCGAAQPPRAQAQSSTSKHRTTQPARVQACRPPTSTPSPTQPAGPNPRNQNAYCSINPVNKVPTKRKSQMPNVVNQKKFCRYRQRSEVAKRLKSCTVPPDQLEYAEYTEELDMDLTLTKKNSDYEIQMYDLSCAVCAYINTCGGLVFIKPIKTYEAKDLENFKNNIKQTLESFIGSNMVRSCIKIEPKVDAKDRLRIKVTKGSSVTNVHSNFYVRDDCLTSEIKGLDEIQNVLNDCHQPVPYDEATSLDRWKGLKYEVQIQIHESKILEYKCYRECETVEDLLEKMTKNTAVEKTLFAFANQPDGGELIIGIRDDNITGNKKVIGQKLPDEATFKNKFGAFMTEGDDGRERIWGKIGHKPQEGKEWSINIIPVDDVPQNERRVLIHIRVNYFPGGVFAACPEAYTVLPDGDVECLDYNAWCDLVFSPEDSSVPAAPAVSQSIPEPSTEKDFELGEDTQSTLANELKRFTEENDKRTPPSVSWTRYSEIWERDKQKLQVENDDMQIDMLQYSSLLTLQTPLDFFPPRSYLLANDTDGKISNSLEDICKYYRMIPAVAFGGFSISSLFPTLVISPPSESHVMDLCVLRSDGIDLWTITADTTSLDNHSTYLISVMRRLKRILLSECHAEVSIKGFVKILGQSQIAIERQTMLGNNEHKFNFRKAFSHLLKKGNTWMKNRFGEDILVMLTRAQMECLLASELAQFSIIDGPPGSGKTLMAFHLIQKLKQTHGLKSHQIKYICPNIALANYAKSQKLCEVGVSAGDHEMLEMIQKDISEGIHHFVFDDQHRIICQTNEWTEMCGILTVQQKHNIKIHMTIFRDSTYQHYGDEESTFMEAINEYKKNHDTFPLLIHSHLHEMLRNCGKVFSFFKANSGEAEGKLQCKNGVMGDDIGIHSHTYEEMLSQKNPALSILNNILQGDHHGHFYRRNDVAILLDLDDKEKESIERNVRRSIQEEFGTDSVQDASKFPVKDIILDSLRNFSGLDAKACILIVKDQNINKNRYKMYAASRGILRVDFLLLKKMDWSGLEAVTKKMHVSDDQIWKQRTNQLYQQLYLHLQCHDIEGGCRDWINNHVPTKHAWFLHLGSLSAVHKGSLNSVPCDRKKTADFLVGYLSQVIRKYLEQQDVEQVLESGLKNDVCCVDDEARMLHVIHQITCSDPIAESQIFDELLSDGLFTAIASVLLRDQLSSEVHCTLSKEVLSVINKHCSEDKFGQQLFDEVGKKSNRQLFLWMKTFLPEQLHSTLFLQICAKNLQTTESNLMESIECSQWPSVKYLELLSLGQEALSCDPSPAVIVNSLNLIHLGVTKLQKETCSETDPRLKQCMESLIQVLDKYRTDAEIVKHTLTAMGVLMTNRSIIQDMLQKERVSLVFTALRQHDVSYIVIVKVLIALDTVLEESGEVRRAAVDQGLVPLLLQLLQHHSDNKIVRNGLWTLDTVMYESGEVRQAAVDQGLIPVLVQLLQHHSDTRVIVRVLGLLDTVMQESGEARQAAVDQGLVPVLLQLLPQHDADSGSVREAADILEILAKHSLVQLTDIQQVVSVLTSIKDKYRLESDLLWNLATESINKALLTIREKYGAAAAAASKGQSGSTTRVNKIRKQ